MAAGYAPEATAAAHAPAAVGRVSVVLRARRKLLALPRGADALLLMVVVAFAVILLDLLPTSFSVDSWLDLVGGRQVWQSGLPHHETFIAMAHGARWVNQQWLSQLFSYLIDQVGGLGLLGLVDVAMMSVGVAVAIAGARKLGARPLSVILLLPLCLLLVVPSHEVRVQAYAMPLASVTVWLLAADSRRPSRRVYWCLPILILWANVHGTAILGAALVGLRALTLLWDRRRSLLHEWRQWRRPLVLGLGAPVCLMLTPYGTQMIAYYRATTGSTALRNLVTEWQPITAMPFVAGVFFILAAILVWSFGRSPENTTSWDKLATLLLGAITIEVLRNALLFALCVLVIGPLSIDSVVGRWRQVKAPERRQLNIALCGAVLLALMFEGVTALAQPQSRIELSYERTQVLQVVRAQTMRDPAMRVFADVQIADWLLWRDPALAGRVAYDGRFELLKPSQMTSLVMLFSAAGVDWKQAAHGDRLLVLDRSASPDTVRGFLAEPGRRVLYDDGTRIVILRTARAAAEN